LSSVFSKPAFFAGLVLIVLGTGMLKPNISAIVGDLYPKADARRDAGFSIFYMGINVGALIAPLITGYLGERVGWHFGFGAAGVGMIIGLITYRLRAGATLGPLGVLPSGTPEQQRTVKNATLVGAGLIAIVVLMAMTGRLTINPIAVGNAMATVMLVTAVLYFGYLLLFAGLDGDERKRIAVIMVLAIFATIFWAAFEQAPTSLNLFAADFTDRNLFGWEVPILWLQSVNSFFVITLAPVFAALWVTMAKQGKELSSIAKFSFALLFAGLGFWLMVAAANKVIAGGDGFRVSMWWLTGSYLLQTIGELALSPVGLSSMTKLSPRRFVGQMMGVWFLATALGNLIAGLVGGHVDPNNLSEMPALFQRTAFSLFIATAVLALMIVPIRKMMGEAKH
jgi:POT family proton-dependent oligopeptide transporter